MTGQAKIAVGSLVTGDPHLFRILVKYTLNSSWFRVQFPEGLGWVMADDLQELNTATEG